MLDIEGDLNGYIEVQSTTIWDAQLNNGAGANKVVVTVQPGWQLTNLQNDLVELKAKVEKMQKETDEEILLRSTNAGLKEAYDKYQTVYNLVKQTVDVLDNNGAT